MAEFKFEGTESVVPLALVPTEKTESSAHERLNLALPSFLGVSDPVSTHSSASPSFSPASTFSAGSNRSG